MITDKLEREAWNSSRLLVGIDEAGYGSVCGCMYVAGVVFPKDFNFGYYLSGLNDSKKLTEEQVSAYAVLVKKHALAFHVEEVTPVTIDNENPNELRFSTAKIVCEKLPGYDFVYYMDGNRAVDFDKKALNKHSHFLVKGDQKSYTIAAASILAKDEKNVEMRALSSIESVYSLYKNKGYLTAQHKDAIIKHGLSKHHRKTYLKKFVSNISPSDQGAKF